MVEIACVLYQGEDVPEHSKGIFDAEWVDRLYRGIKRNTTRDFRFVCYSDQEYPFKEPIERRPFRLPYKNMFSLLEPFQSTERTIFMGLDTIITGNIDFLFDLEGFWMLRDPYFPERDCSGVMVFDPQPELWEFIEGNHERLANENRMFGHPSDMIFLDKVSHKTIEGPERGIYSYKVHVRDSGLPKDAKIVYFHGREKPHELSEPWVIEHWGHGRKISYSDSLNNDRKVMLEQVRQNLERDLPWFAEQNIPRCAALIVGGGPSLKESLTKLRFLKQFADIFALNGAHDYLIERGIVPNYHVLLDSRPANVDFVKRPKKRVKYLVSAFCHPSVFDALEGYDVTLWVNDMDGVMNLIKPYVDSRPVVLVGGGATVGMKTMYLTYLMGYRKFHFFGFDSCYRGDNNHAYRQAMNDKESRLEVEANGKKFTVAPWMAKQAMEFQGQARKLIDLGCEINVHGDGLIAWIMQKWNEVNHVPSYPDQRIAQ